MAGAADPVELLFGGLAKLGPGSDAETLRALRAVPQQTFNLVVDAGCGSGRQTLVLARELGRVVHAVDVHQPFLDALMDIAEAIGIQHLVQVRLMDMKDIPAAYREIDLLWSEGSAYNIGFANALRTWAPAIADGGFAVVSELSWLTDNPPLIATDFFGTAYPAMVTIDANAAIARDAGFEVLTTFDVSRKSWTEDYYDLLRPRAHSLLDHPDDDVRMFAAETIREIELFDQCGDSYGYVFYVLRRV